FVFQLITAGLFIPLIEGDASFLLALAAISIFTIPVIGYSLYYQYAVANTWCRLCLMVDGLLTVQIAIFAAMFFLQELFTGSSAQIRAACIVSLLFLTVASSIILIKNRL